MFLLFLHVSFICCCKHTRKKLFLFLGFFWGVLAVTKNNPALCFLLFSVLILCYSLSSPVGPRIMVFLWVIVFQEQHQQTHKKYKNNTNKNKNGSLHFDEGLKQRRFLLFFFFFLKAPENWTNRRAQLINIHPSPS